MLRRLKILQIGDIHFPASSAVQGALDDKDESFPTSLKTIMSNRPLKTVFKKIYEIMEFEAPDGILFMGDFTDFGKLDGFDACCKYISGALQLGKDRLFESMPVGLVPGNHDINRKLAVSPGREKFTALSRTLASHGLPTFPVEDPIQLDIGGAELKASVQLLNSCWGCGEYTHIPKEFSAAISAAIENTLNGPNGENALSTYYNRQLDTPAFSDETVRAVIDRISVSPMECMAIIVAHHNLLPQRLPRLAPYTELVNSGALRSSLLELNRPIIYLHGHIHEEPVEALQAPGGWPLVIISAPIITKGFNVIEIVYAPDSVPIVCNIIPHRFDGSGVLKRQVAKKISLISKSRLSVFPGIASFYSKLVERRTSYWNDIVDIISHENIGFSSDKAIQMLEILHSENNIEIENYDLSFRNWMVRA